MQFPEGLKQKGLELAQQYESQGHEVFLSASPCYGACDICLDEARWIKADKIVHFGHNKFVRGQLEIPVEYVPYTMDIDVSALEDVLEYLKPYKTIGLLTTVQNVHQISQLKEWLANHGITALTDTGYWAHAQGQVLGCDALSIKKLEDKIEAVLYVGDGMFHPLAIESQKPIFAYSPYTKKVVNMKEELEKLRKRRRASLVRSIEAKRFAIMVSTKVGQFNLHQAEWAKKEIEKRGRIAAILVANELEPITLNNFMTFESYVNTACPRMVDDTAEFGKPILSMDLLKELLALWDGDKERAERKG